jgi:hypothetical protein
MLLVDSLMGAFLLDLKNALQQRENFLAFGDVPSCAFARQRCGTYSQSDLCATYTGAISGAILTGKLITTRLRLDPTSVLRYGQTGQATPFSLPLDYSRDVSHRLPSY